MRLLGLILTSFLCPMLSAVELQTGQSYEIEGHSYRVEGELGRGNFGVVYAVSGNGRQMALKVMNDRINDHLDSEIKANKFAASLDSTSHGLSRSEMPFLAQGEVSAVLADGKVVASHAVLMERAHPMTLQSLLPALRLSSDPAQAAANETRLRAVRNILVDLLRAWSVYGPRGWSHRDIKPENILFRVEPGETLSVESIAEGKVTAILGDAGSFREQGAIEVTGSPHFMGPDALSGRPSDPYSYTVVAYVALTGSHPTLEFLKSNGGDQANQALDDVLKFLLSQEKIYQNPETEEKLRNDAKQNFRRLTPRSLMSEEGRMDAEIIDGLVEVFLARDAETQESRLAERGVEVPNFRLTVQQGQMNFNGRKTAYRSEPLGPCSRPGVSPPGDRFPSTILLDPMVN